MLACNKSSLIAHSTLRGSSPHHGNTWRKYLKQIGGNGETYDIYRDETTRATVVGQSETTSDGIQIDGVRLGYTNVRDRITPLYATQRVQAGGQVLNINAYFTVTVPVSEPGWWLFVHLLDAQGNKVAERATVPRSDYAITTWPAGQQVVVNADLPVSLPAGDYTLELGFRPVMAHA